MPPTYQTAPCVATWCASAKTLSTVTRPSMPSSSSRSKHRRAISGETPYPARLAHRNVARAELLGDMVLPQLGARFQRTGDDPVGKNPAGLTMNLLYVDCVEYARGTDLCFVRNGLG